MQNRAWFLSVLNTFKNKNLQEVKCCDKIDHIVRYSKNENDNNNIMMVCEFGADNTRPCNVRVGVTRGKEEIMIRISTKM